MPLFGGNLLPASFRGAPFAVSRNDSQGGRRIALHQYPGRDEPWAEDMGRAPRRFHFSGFIVDNDVVFAGGPIQLQRALLISAIEAQGPGLLTHPTLGVINVVVTNAAIGEDLGAETMSTVEFEFVEAGKRQYPTASKATSGLLTIANQVKAALVADGVRLIAEAFNDGARRKDLQVTAATFTTKAIGLGADATALYRVASLLPGEYGRFASGSNAGAFGISQSPFDSATTIGDLIGRSSALRASILSATTAAGEAIDTSDLAYAPDIGSTAVALVESLAAACSDPADAMRLLGQLVTFVSPRPESLTPIGTAYAGMIRRAAAAEMVNAGGRYQPSSANEAAVLIGQLAGSIGGLAEEAADAGDDDSFRALRAARGAVIRDLRLRGATLASLRAWTIPTGLPAPALAQRLYRDPTRAAELIAQAGVPHPLFMPTDFTALAA
jgi:prophage DNA circulation protein